MRPLIAMPQMGTEPFREYMKSKYVESLNRAGADVCWIELEDLDSCTRQMLACDGLLLPGGADIAPALYGQEVSPLCQEPNPLRDAAEWKMLEAFLPTNKPIFCICRGAQFLNVFFGGTLHQHMDGHADFDSRAEGYHDVTLRSGTRLSQILSRNSCWVNSLHHQAADQIGTGLMVSATAEDGTVEALELSGHPFCIGVQWHPEHLSESRTDQQGLFDAFVAQCNR